MTAAPLDRAWLQAHLPHQGAMCLLQQVLVWDAQTIRCRADNHRDLVHPLRHAGRLHAVCGIEYAAQAMAAHGALLAQRHERPRAGFLASVRGVGLHVERLDTIDAPLDIVAERISGADAGILYGFRVSAGDVLLLDGRAAVILDADAAGGRS